MIGEVSRSEIEDLDLSECAGCRSSGEHFATLNGQITEDRPNGAVVPSTASREHRTNVVYPTKINGVSLYTFPACLRAAAGFVSAATDSRKSL
jgi:hypothetical protein